MRKPGTSRPRPVPDKFGINGVNEIGAKSEINSQIVKLTSFLQKAFPLALCVGAMLFFLCLPASAEDALLPRDTIETSMVRPGDRTSLKAGGDAHDTIGTSMVRPIDRTSLKAGGDACAPGQDTFALGQDARDTVGASSAKSRWLDEHPKRLGLTYGADINLVANYIWRGLYVGGPSVQASANVGYGGLFVDMWWNVGSTDWAFQGFLPEVDISVGFSRWGFRLFIIHMCYFDGTGLFDFKQAAPGQPGNTTELRAGYKVSSKLPLSILWCTRFTSRDGYLLEDGTVKRAWSSYLELGYDFALPYDMTLSARLGMTPWKSLYTGYQGDFAVNNIALTLRKDWSLSAHCGLHLSADLMLNPWRISRENIRWSATEPGEQRLNANISCGVYLK